MPSPKPLPPMTRTSLQEGHYTTTLLEESFQTRHPLPEHGVLCPQPRHFLRQRIRAVG